MLSTLNVVRREGVRMQVGFTLADGRELPLVVRRPEVRSSRRFDRSRRCAIATEEGALPLGEVTQGTRMPAPPMISHHNGRRELVDQLQFRRAMRRRPGPTRLRARRGDRGDRAQRVSAARLHDRGGRRRSRPPIGSSCSLVPILLLLYAVLAITFESLTMPLLVLVSVPLTILGATWALVLAGVGAGVYALVGVIALLGLTVNPAILLVDRMQRRSLDAGASGGSAAIAAVRERTRPVLMTSCTTIAGLWPLALSTGDEYEIWPPFATVVMGGLATSTLLTLLVIPVGYVLFATARPDLRPSRTVDSDGLGGRDGSRDRAARRDRAVDVDDLADRDDDARRGRVPVARAGDVPPRAAARIRSWRGGDRSALPQEGLRPAGAGEESLAAR